MSSPEEKNQLYWTAGTTYDNFLAEENIPVHGGHYVQDAGEVEVGDWDRTGGRAAIIDLVGHEGLNDLHVHEIPAGSELKQMSTLYEEIVYVVSGRGATILGAETDNSVTFEWEKDALFFLPANVSHKHINQSGEEPARLVSDTNLPTLFRLFRDPDYIFTGGEEFAAVTKDAYSEDGELSVISGVPAIWDANFVPDVSTFDQLVDYSLRGAGGTNVKFRFPAARSLRAHMSEFPVGTYKKAHKHGPGANVFVIKGEGYTLMWPPGGFEDRVRVDWQRGSLAVPPSDWYHQHFNLSSEPARYLALHRPNVLPSGPEPVFDSKHPKNFVEYADEDPRVREIFEQELKERGQKFRMPEECYTNPDYKFEMDFTPQ